MIDKFSYGGVLSKYSANNVRLRMHFLAIKAFRRESCAQTIVEKTLGLFSTHLFAIHFGTEIFGEFE